MSQPKPKGGGNAVNANTRPKFKPGAEGIPSRSRTVGQDKFHTTQSPAGFAELLPVDIAEGTWNADQLAKRHDQREAVHNSAVVARHDFNRDLSQKTVNCQSHNEQPRGDAGKLVGDHAITPTRSNAVGSAKLTDYPSSFSDTVTQSSPGKPWKTVKASQFRPVKVRK